MLNADVSIGMAAWRKALRMRYWQCWRRQLSTIFL